MSNQTFGPSEKGFGDGVPDKSQAAPTLTSQVQGVLDQQITRGANVMTNVANAARRAADEIEPEAPQIAGLVRGSADWLDQYSHDLQDQSAQEIYRNAAEFTRRQPAAVFGVAALAGFFALRVLRSSETITSSRSGRRFTRSSQAEDFHGS